MEDAIRFKPFLPSSVVHKYDDRGWSEGHYYDLEVLYKGIV